MILRLFTGWDAREAAGWHCFVDSVYLHASEPVTITRLPEKQLDGSNAFTFSRFLVPDLCEYQGWAIYADGCDMLMLADIAELWSMQDQRCAIQVVQHAYATKFTRKYLGTPMESDNKDYPRKNWSSVILWNCGHPALRRVIEDQRFAWLPDDLIGALPIEWNWLADEYGYDARAKLLHWTAGIPVQALHMNTTRF